MTKIILVGIILVFAISAVAFMQSRAAYESADYTVIISDGPYEIRDYEEATLVSAPMDDPSMENRSAFMKLFGYISGSNEKGEKISMTTPVYSTRGEGGDRMSFVVPRDVAEKGAPLPISKDVTIEKMKPGKFAAYRFNGSLTAKRFAEAREQLSIWVRENDLRTKGDFISAGYDPPYTPSIMRRNEVLIRLAK